VRRAAAALALALVAGCTASDVASAPDASGPGGEPDLSACGGHPGLRVVVDLSAPGCADVPADGSTAEVAATLDGPTRTRDDAEHVVATTAPRGTSYWWRWPAGTTDGWEGTVYYGAWIGSVFTPMADARYQVLVDRCVTVELTASCTAGIQDAGVR